MLINKIIINPVNLLATDAINVVGDDEGFINKISDSGLNVIIPDKPTSIYG